MAQHINWLRVIISFTLSVLVVFLPIRQLKMNKIFKQVPKYKRVNRFGAIDSQCRSVNRAAVFEQQVQPVASIKMPSMCKRLSGRMRPAASSGSTSSNSGNHYQKQHQRESRSTPNLTYEYELVAANSALAPLDTFLHAYYKYIVRYDWWLLFKHVIVCLLRFDCFAHFRYLDCYLVGRFVVNGRVIQLACYCACFLLTYKLAWFYTIRRKCESDFKLSCFEFLLVSQEEVARWASRASSRVSMRSEDASRGQDDNVGTKLGTSDSDQLHSTIFECPNPFESNDHTKSYGLRPNRTPECWRDMTRATLRYYKIFALVLVSLQVFFIRMFLPVTVNQKGFEYNYRYCIHHITTERIKTSQDSGYSGPNWASSYFFSLVRHNQDELGGSLGKIFFNTPVVSKNFRLSSRMSDDFLQPIKDVVDMNMYHGTRIFFDIVDSGVIYFQVVFALNCSLFMIVILCKDVVHYCSALNARLSSLIVALRSTSTINLNVPDDYYYNTNIKYNDRLSDLNIYPRPRLTSRSMDLIRTDIHEIQAMIADMFTMIDAYNKYISYQMICLLLFWLGYSAMVSSWIFIPGNDSPKTEWFTLHVFATIFVFACMYQFSGVKKECQRMHSRIVVAMALDEFSNTSKITWTSLLKFYSPVPMFCFTIIKSIELNFMFGLKMLAWLFSALIVASSFFTVYRID